MKNNSAKLGWSSSNQELQNCVTEASQVMHRHNNDFQVQLAGLLAAGRYVLVESSPWHCRSTDAVVGHGHSVRGSFLSREQAEGALAVIHSTEMAYSDSDFRIYPLVPNLNITIE